MKPWKNLAGQLKISSLQELLKEWIISMYLYLLKLWDHRRMKDRRRSSSLTIFQFHSHIDFWPPWFLMLGEVWVGPPQSGLELTWKWDDLWFDPQLITHTGVPTANRPWWGHDQIVLSCKVALTFPRWSDIFRLVASGSENWLENNLEIIQRQPKLGSSPNIICRKRSKTPTLRKEKDIPERNSQKHNNLPADLFWIWPIIFDV